jgi:hypothetical protein
MSGSIPPAVHFCPLLTAPDRINSPADPFLSHFTLCKARAAREDVADQGIGEALTPGGQIFRAHSFAPILSRHGTRGLRTSH